jgi:hypothetical protein
LEHIGERLDGEDRLSAISRARQTYDDTVSDKLVLSDAFYHGHILHSTRVCACASIAKTSQKQRRTEE